MTHDSETISKLINNVINSANNCSNSQKFKDSSSIKFNVNINNNYFNSNYNYVINEQQPIKEKKEEGGFTGFFSNLIFNIENILGYGKSKEKIIPKKNINFNKQEKPLKIINGINSIPSCQSIPCSPKSVLDTKSSLNFESKKTKNDNFMFVPCINCNNLIHIDEIGILKINPDDHSDKCVRVKEDVIVAEKGEMTYENIKHKLNKMEEHLINIENHDNSGICF